ncbi:Bleomycin hydrolase [Sergentomyia squamirostris]
MSCSIVGCKMLMKQNREISFHTFPDPKKEPFRFGQWLEATGNAKLKKINPSLVYSRYRICRNHFGKECFNGDCKRLMKTALPTLNLSGALDEEEEFVQNPPSPKRRKITETPIPEDHHYIQSGEIVHEKRIIRPKGDKDVRVVYVEKYCPEIQSTCENSSESIIYEDLEILDNQDDSILYEITDSTQEDTFPVPITHENCANWRDEFYKCQKNVLAQNICSRHDPFDVSLSRRTLETIQHVFTHKVENEGKPMTNQKNSGRCWLFATLNTIRIHFMKQHNLDEFEFSQSYLFYWDKIERCNYFLNNIVDTANRGEEVNGRLVSFLLTDPTCDGGQWDMVVNLINKYGLMPKKCFPESYSAEASGRMNAVLKSKLRQYAKDLRDLIKVSTAEKDIKQKIEQQMKEIYNIVGICLGIPPETFTWEYYDKSKVYQKIGPITAKDFYEQHVKSAYNMDDKVCLVTDPRPTNPYGQAYTVDCLGNVVGGRPVLYNNQPVELLIDLVTTSIKNGDPVWFGCDVHRRFAGTQGIEDLNVHDFNVVFGVDIQVTLNKADRLLYGESAMTHAMTFTGVSVDANDMTTKFRVENSWGEDRGEKGYLVMSTDWFKEFVFEVVVDKSIVPAEVRKVFEMTPIVLPAWDPMGTLAI